MDIKDSNTDSKMNTSTKQTIKEVPDAEMLENLDLLLIYDLLENEKDWNLLISAKNQK